MTVAVTSGQVATAFARRAGPVRGLAADADELAAACRAMARRFARGGRLLRAEGLALVDTGAGTEEEISVALVDAAVGDVVLVHAGEAIATVRS